MVKPDSQGQGLGQLSSDLQPVKKKTQAVIGHQNFAAAVKKVVEPMGKTSLVLDMVQEHDSG